MAKAIIKRGTVVRVAEPTGATWHGTVTGTAGYVGAYRVEPAQQRKVRQPSDRLPCNVPSSQVHRA